MDSSQRKGISFEQVTLKDSFWTKWLSVHKKAVLPVCIANCEEKSGRISNYRKAAGTLPGEFEGRYRDDSDVYKSLEGIAYSLAVQPDSELERKADEWIDAIASAQQEDGYLVCYFIMGVNGDQRWSDMNKHEDYCLGHMIEAAIAYRHATGKDKFLKTAIRFADHFLSLFGEGKRHWVTGHQELELALMKLYEETGEEKYLKEAHWLLEERGHGYGRGEGIWGKAEWGSRYTQDDKPVREMTDIAGHAVRAMYLYCGMCDVGKYLKDGAYLQALNRLWESTVLRNMYITGGIGSSKDNEGFTADYDLPNDTAYCETCAAVGMIFWNHRMNLLYGDGKYADIVERELYNGALAGVSLDGKKFFYVNPLASDGTHHRQEWYGTACCPTQLSRFLPSVGGYIYQTDSAGLWVSQYISSRTEAIIGQPKVVLSQQSGFPWNGTVKLRFEMECKTSFLLSLRLPDWCKDFELFLNGKPYPAPYREKGYLKLMREWDNGDELLLDFKMPVKLVRAHPKVKNDQGMVAVRRGPVIYCAEQLDNTAVFDSVVFDRETVFTQQWEENFLNGVMTVVAHTKSGEYRMIPYYAWDNREASPMKVWVPYQES